MSTIAVNAITDANGGSTTSINGTTPNAYNTVGKNLIINGAMQIAQRGTSSTSTGYTTVDRFTSYASNTDQLAVSLEQSTDAPDGFSNSFKWTTTTAETTLESNEYTGVQQKIEAQTIQHLAYGTTSAKKVTLSFWVKSSVTGTYAVSVYQDDANRITGSTYTINTANTWEKKTVTFDGDTSGTINNDSGEGFRCIFHISAGSDLTSTDNTSWGAYSGGKWAYGHAQNGVVTTTNATWQITGVQLEVGESATEFEHRPYSLEKLLCYRYYYVDATDRWLYSITTNDSGYRRNHVDYPVAMRTTPTVNGTFGSTTTTTGIQFSGPRGVTFTSDSVPAGSYTYVNFNVDAEL